LALSYLHFKTMRGWKVNVTTVSSVGLIGTGPSEVESACWWVRERNKYGAY
jgi:hypothetical protein